MLPNPRPEEALLEFSRDGRLLNVGVLTRSQCRVARGPLGKPWVDFT